MADSLLRKTCCFTGHRFISPEKISPLVGSLHSRILLLAENGYRYFGCGGALGFDTLAAEEVIKLRRELPQIKLILVLPCANQQMYWNDFDQRRYLGILKQADKVVYTAHEYYSGCMQKRNRHLVDHSSCCVCYLERNTGGTAYTVAYAKEKGLTVINLAEP